MNLSPMAISNATAEVPHAPRPLFCSVHFVYAPRSSLFVFLTFSSSYDFYAGFSPFPYVSQVKPNEQVGKYKTILNQGVMQRPERRRREGQCSADDPPFFVFLSFSCFYIYCGSMCSMGSMWAQQSYSAVLHLHL